MWSGLTVCVGEVGEEREGDGEGGGFHGVIAWWLREDISV